MGQRQVRHWNDEDDLILLPMDGSDIFDFWNSSGIEEDSLFPVTRHLKPIQGEVEEPFTRKWVLQEQWSLLKQFCTKGWNKLQRMSQRLPSAFKAAAAGIKLLD